MTHDWRDQAACRDRTDINFFPSKGATCVAEYEAARAICHRCPVQNECLDFALQFPNNECPGMWGGLTQEQRRKVRRGINPDRKPGPTPLHARPEFARVVQLRKAGWSYRAIGAELDLNFRTVEKALKVHGNTHTLPHPLSTIAS